MGAPHLHWCDCKECLDWYFDLIVRTEESCRERDGLRPLKRWEMNRLLPRVESVRERWRKRREEDGNQQ